MWRTLVARLCRRRHGSWRRRRLGRRLYCGRRRWARSGRRLMAGASTQGKTTTGNQKRERKQSFFHNAPLKKRKTTPDGRPTGNRLDHPADSGPLESAQTVLHFLTRKTIYSNYVPQHNCFMPGDRFVNPSLVLCQGNPYTAKDFCAKRL